MIFVYKAIDQTGRESEGTIDAVNVDVAISSLQRRGLVVSSIHEEGRKGLLDLNFSFFESVSNRDIVIISRQIATLFAAQISALRVFRMLSSETESVVLAKILAAVADDLQGGNAISKALAKHPEAFTAFYVNMVKSGEESGKLSDTFAYLADYLDRNYQVGQKVKNALIYPAFVMGTFVAVMTLMLTTVVPKISAILIDSGQELPIYTKIVLAFSDFLVSFGLPLLAVIIMIAFALYRYIQTEPGKVAFSYFKFSVPVMGDLYHKLYLTRIVDNLGTMLGSGIPIIRALEITGDVVDNIIYERILKDAATRVKAGGALSDSLPKGPEIPGVVIQMTRVGEESGELESILHTLAKFYSREVTNAVDSMVGLIEPIMIVMLGLGVGFILAAVLMPIYNMTGNIN